jgi:hypothetical protein
VLELDGMSSAFGTLNSKKWRLGRFSLWFYVATRLSDYLGTCQPLASSISWHASCSAFKCTASNGPATSSSAVLPESAINLVRRAEEDLLVHSSAHRATRAAITVQQLENSLAFPSTSAGNVLLKRLRARRQRHETSCLPSCPVLDSVEIENFRRWRVLTG